MVLRKKFLLGVVGFGIVGAAAQPHRVAVVVGNSMAPTYQSGQLLLTRPVDRPLRHSDVVVVDGPEGPILKRVVLIEGDHRTQWLNKTGWMDMTTLVKPHTSRGLARTRTIPIPVGHVYLLGDNLDSSIDSRTFGPVPVESVRGLVVDARSPASGAAMLRDAPKTWIAEGIRENRLLAHRNGRKSQPTNL